MATSGDVLEMDALGVRVTLLRTAEETNGDLLEFEVLGRPRGIIAQGHVHAGQTERHEVLSGAMKLVLDGAEHVLTAGQSMEVPPNAPHSQLAAGEGAGRVRVQLRPASDSQG